MPVFFNAKVSQMNRLVNRFRVFRPFSRFPFGSAAETQNRSQSPR